MAETVVDPRKLMRARLQQKQLERLSTLDTASVAACFDGNADADASARVNKMAFREAMQRQQVSLFDDDDLVDSFFAALDADLNGTVDKKELLVGLAVLSNGTLQQKLRIGFRAFDVNRDGFVQPDELRLMFSKLSAADTDLDALVASVMTKADENHDGELEEDEFYAAAQRDEQIARLFTLDGVLKPSADVADAKNTAVADSATAQPQA